MISRTIEKLSDPGYRNAFVGSQINIGIPFQIRALLKARGWTQEELAKRTGMLQPRISAMMTPGKTRPNIETLRRFAEAFDCGLMVHFVPFSELVRWSDNFDPENFAVPSFDEERDEVSQEPQLVRKMAASASTMTNATGGRIWEVHSNNSKVVVHNVGTGDAVVESPNRNEVAMTKVVGSRAWMIR